MFAVNARGLKAVAIIVGVAGVAACVPPAPEPTPAPTSDTRTPGRPPIVTELPTPSFDDWMDAPQTPGDWRYLKDMGQTRARFGLGDAAGSTRAVIACDLATRRVALERIVDGGSRDGGGAGTVSPSLAQMRVRSEFGDRTVEAHPVATQSGTALVGQFAAADPFLESIAFSKGRFALEAAGQETLYLPAYPEITRVIEDCRAGPL